jgi:hypothetical protein
LPALRGVGGIEQMHGVVLVGPGQHGTGRGQ